MQYLWIVWSLLKLIVIVLLWLLLCLKMLWISLMWVLRYKVNVMFNVEIDCMHVQWILLCFKSIYCLLVWFLRREWTMKFYYFLWMPRTKRVWTSTLVYVTCDLYFYNILIFTNMHFGLSPGVFSPWKIACYKFWDVVNIVVMLFNFW